MSLLTGAHVQLLWPESAVLEGLGEELIQGRQMGSQGVQVWGLPSSNPVITVWKLVAVYK